MFLLDRTRGIESRSVSATTTNVTYTFDAFRNNAFTGLLLVDLQQPIPTTATDTLPVLFGSVQLLNSIGGQATVADLGGAGTASLVLVYYNSRSGRLQLVGTYEAPAAAAAATASTTEASGSF
jgi:hypothetical protein